MAGLKPPPGGIQSTPDKGVLFLFGASLVFGLYLATFAFTVRWILFTDEGWKWKRGISWPTVSVTFFIFALTTVYAAMDVKEVVDAVRLLITNPGQEYKMPTWMVIVKCTFANLVALSADLVLIYRCYVVFARRLWVIVFPVFLWLGSVVCTVLQLYLQIAHISDPSIGPYHWASVNMVEGPGIVLLPFWGATAALNLYCTGMLIWRIYQASVESEMSGSTKQLRLVVRFIAESGFIYLSITIAHFVVWFTYNNFAIQVISALNVPLIGIAFNLILIRAANSKQERYYNEKALGQVTSIEFSAGEFSTTAATSVPTSHSRSHNHKMLESTSQMSEP